MHAGEKYWQITFGCSARHPPYLPTTCHARIRMVGLAGASALGAKAAVLTLLVQWPTRDGGLVSLVHTADQESKFKEPLRADRTVLAGGGLHAGYGRAFEAARAAVGGVVGQIRAQAIAARLPRPARHAAVAAAAVSTHARMSHRPLRRQPVTQHDCF